MEERYRCKPGFLLFFCFKGKSCSLTSSNLKYIYLQCPWKCISFKYQKSNVLFISVFYEEENSFNASITSY